MLLRQLKVSCTKKYPPELRSFALTLHFYSPMAYNFVRKTFGKCIPHPSTLRKWYASVDGAPGFTAEALEAIKMKVNEMKSNEKQLICGLVMDEMFIREHVQWNGKRHQGFVNFGTGTDQHDSLPKAREALVFLIVALNSRWKIPVGYFLINGLSAESKANLIINCLSQIHNTGVIVKTLTFDGAATNMSAVNLLGAKLQWPDIKPFFLHPETKENVYIILDACHMLKLCRNTLGDWGVIYNGQGKPIKWKFFEHLVNLQNNSGLHAATKIRNRHLNYQKEKMKVKLAVQTFSNSVAEAIEFCNKDLKMDEFNECCATVEFCKFMNNIFDVLNTRNMLSKLTFKRPISKSNYEFIHNFINKSVDYISFLRDNHNKQKLLESPRKTGFLGLIVCLKSINLFFNEALNKNYLKYILTYKLSQDHIEMFFSAIRSKCGFNNNPTAGQFEAAYKRLLIHSEICVSSQSNCLPQDSTNILHVSSLNKIENSHLDTLFVEEIEDLADFSEDTISFGQHHLYIENVIGHIAGFVTRKALKLINCEICARGLVSENVFFSRLSAKKK